MQSALFGLVNDVEIVPLAATEVDRVHEIYVELARLGKGSTEQRQFLTDLAKILIRREKLGAIILAGPDFVSLLSESNTDFPAVDCAGLHIRSILARVFEARPVKAKKQL